MLTQFPRISKPVHFSGLENPGWVWQNETRVFRRNMKKQLHLKQHESWVLWCYMCFASYVIKWLLPIHFGPIQRPSCTLSIYSTETFPEFATLISIKKLLLKANEKNTFVFMSRYIWNYHIFFRLMQHPAHLQKDNICTTEYEYGSCSFIYPILPTVNCWSLVVSSCWIYHMELSLFRCTFVQPSQSSSIFLFHKSFPMYYYSTVFSYFYTLLWTLKLQ